MESMVMIKNTYNVVSFYIATVRSSNISVRLVSPYSGVDFLGRVEVLHNGQWGTICDRYFRIADANVICGMAGFSEAICAVHNAGFGRGYYSTLCIILYDWQAESNTLLAVCICLHIDPIWLYNIGCSTGDEVLEDCSRLNWGSYSRYCSHYDDVGVICKPSEIEQ